MGQEVACSARVGGREQTGKALLESTEIVFRGDDRVRVAFADISELAVDDGWLTLRHPGGELALDLGAKAARWEQRVRNPPTLADKLGIKAGQQVALVDVDHGDLPALLAGAGASVVSLGSRPDLVIAQADAGAALGRLPELAAGLAPGGAVWVVHPRGSAEVPERDVLSAGRAAGLVDTKVARFSDTHTAHRFSTPRTARR